MVIIIIPVRHSFYQHRLILPDSHLPGLLHGVVHRQRVGAVDAHRVEAVGRASRRDAVPAVLLP